MALKKIDKEAYPFKSNYGRTRNERFHYIKEGDEGPVLLFVHGTPTWSFLYRDFIKHFSKTHICVAIDHVGFGLSDKPVDFDYSAQNLAEGVDVIVSLLGLKDITLIVHDFGGPIGLSYAIKRPENVSRIVLFNTWLWETKNDKDANKINKILHSTLGNFIYLNTNFSPKVLLKKAFYNKKALTKQAHDHYKFPFPNKKSRYGLLGLGKSLIGNSDWYQELYNQIDRIKDIPTLILWGIKDEFIKPNQLKKWEETMTNSKTITYDCGHFVQEECTEEAIKDMEEFLSQELVKS